MDYEGIVKGHLKCIDCIYNSNCEEVNDRCVANYIYEGEVAHIKNMEVPDYDRNV